MTSPEPLERYADVAGKDVVEHLRQLAAPLKGLRLVHINSTRVGGGVAEILHKMVPLMNDLGIDARWEVISGEAAFYQCTKSFHNGMQGNRVDIPEAHLRVYEDANRQAASGMRDILEAADLVIVHDPQPAALISHFPDRRNKWIWRCHIDASHPFRPVWKYLKQSVVQYDAVVFSLAAFAQRLPNPIYLIAPSIDPLNEKNENVPAEAVEKVRRDYGIDPERPTILQVSRYDRFKDPVGVVQAYRLAKRFLPSLQLVLAGGTATDDPEGAEVLEEVHAVAGQDPDLRVLLLPGDAHHTINALQRASDVVLQKSVREGFGLTVTEAMWKHKPVIGGDTGGIRMQVINYHTGFLVNTPEGAALRIRYLFDHPHRIPEIGKKAKEFVRENFLLTRHLREYLTMIVGILNGHQDRIELD